jgi:hypothetical protein
MPYVYQHERDRVDEILEELSFVHPGGLNYAITKLCQDYMQSDRRGKNLTYANYNTIIGVLESVKLEFYRRAVVPYEDEKIQENGDVY